jgi:peptidoglycan/LPS O-acetylase OafA/YrhL
LHAVFSALTVQSPDSRTYMPQLDALRAFAVLAVMVHHFLPIDHYIPSDYVTLGFLAVRLFFVLSGFLITGILLDYRSDERGQALRRFYSRRVLRIFPIYYLTIFIALALQVRPIQEGAFWHLTYLSNYVAASHPEWMGPASHFWSLAVEEQFYLVWPFILLFVPQKHLAKVIIGSIALAVLFRGFVLFVLRMPIDVAGVFTFATLDSLGGGALLALFRYDERLRTRLPSLMKSFLIGGLGIVILCTVLYIYNIGFSILHTFLCLGISLLFVVLIEKTARGFTGKAKAVMETPAVLYIGKISYGLYVYHNFMLAIVLYYLLKRTAVPDFRLVALLATVGTFGTAIVSWHLIERPVAQLKNRLDVNFRGTRLGPESVQFRPSEEA